MIRLSLVIPCFNEEEVIPLFYAEASQILSGLMENNAPAASEMIFVDDGSRDGTAKVLRELALKDSRVHYLVFSRNFGKEAAMLAGLEEARGVYCHTRRRFTASARPYPQDAQRAPFR